MREILEKWESLTKEEKIEVLNALRAKDEELLGHWWLAKEEKSDA